jgi:hypothetical protein
MKYRVTLRTNLKRGSFLWVAEVEADGEEAAALAAERLFEAQMDSGEEWSFEEFAAEPL